MSDLNMQTRMLELINRDKIEALAYHEAGHAVVAELVDPGTLGRIQFKRSAGATEGTVFHRTARGSEENALINLAGYHAELFYIRVTEERRAAEYRRGERQNSYPGFLPSESPKDTADVDAYIRRGGPGHEYRKLVRRDLGKAVARLLRMNWDKVEGVARALLNADGVEVTLTRSQCLQAMGLQTAALGTQRATSPATNTATAPAGELRTMTRQELVELRSQAQANNQHMLFRLLNNHIEGKSEPERRTFNASLAVMGSF